MDLSYIDLPNKTLLVWQEVASFLCVSRQTVFRLREEGKIEGIRVRGSVRFFRESVICYIETEKQQ